VTGNVAANLARPELVVHIFAPATGPNAATAYGYLRQVWSGCRGRLGMTMAVPNTEVGCDLPERISPLPATEAFAAIHRPGTGVFQAVLRREGDLLILSAVLSPAADPGPNPPPAPGWAELDHQWQEITGPPPAALIGEARLYLAYLAESPAAAGMEEMAESVRSALTSVTGDPGPLLPRVVVAPGLAVWETAAQDQARACRRIAVLAGAERANELSAWTWSRGDLALPPFARYLSHAAILRYQLRVWGDGAVTSQVRRQIDAPMARLVDLLVATGRETTNVGTEELDAAAARVTELLVSEIGLIVTVTRLRQMRRAVEATQANLESALPALAGDDRERGLFGGDRTLGAWFGQVLDDDVVYLDATRDRARDLIERADAVVRRRLQDRQEAARARQERFNLLQTAVIGALIMTLTAVQAFSYKVPLSDQAKPAIVALLGAVTFYLAARVLTLALPRRGGLFAWVGHLAAGTAVAMLIWTVLAWTHGFGLRPSVRPGVTLTLACVGFIAGTAAAAALARRR
jgi:hypothetical protein